MTRRTVASLTGLAVAWGGTLLLISPPAHRLFGDPAHLPMAFAGLSLMWVLAAAIVAILLVWERQPLASLWLKPFGWQSIAWGLLLVAVNYAVLFPAGEWIRQAAGLPGFAQGAEPVMQFPLSYRIVAVIGAGIVEELLFRGYTITRLSMLTGNIWLAAALSLTGFSALHLPGWGWGFVIGGLFGGVAATAFFVWKKDLLAMMVFHAITDAMGFIVAPAFSEWWREPRAL
jgi:CAAX protease family protein